MEAIRFEIGELKAQIVDGARKPDITDPSPTKRVKMLHEEEMIGGDVAVLNGEIEELK